MITKNNRQSGQSLIEFLMIFSLSFGFIFLYIQLATNAGTGYLVHYATFMASRTFLSQDNGSNTNQSAESYAEREAKAVIDKFQLSAFGISSPSNKIKINTTSDVSIFEYVGAYFTYETRLSIFSTVGGSSSAELISESFLGKEPTRAECLERVCSSFKSLYECDSFATAFDNGC
ncbi:MAG: hypothetical protein HOE90_08130 [Bacteriovoracaceae bacterium]|jgi:hypothetical protein|nr:hypothetical protein [Bacteriovoracaceae bacterium]